MLIFAYTPLAFGSDFDEVQAVAEPAVPILDGEDRARVFAAAPAMDGGEEWVAIELPDHGLLELREHQFSYTPDVLTDIATARARGEALLAEAQARFVAEIVEAAGEGRLDQLGVPRVMSAVLGPACPERVCAVRRVGPRQLAGFPTVDSGARTFGDVAVTDRGDLALFALDEHHLLAVRDGGPPRVVMHSWVASETAALQWFSLVSGPRALGMSLSPAQIEALVTALPMGLPDSLVVEAPRTRVGTPPRASASLGLEGWAAADSEGIASGVGAQLLLGVPIQLETTVPLVVNPFVGAGVSHRPFSETTDGKYAGLETEPTAVAVGIGLAAEVPDRRRWWVIGVASEFRAEGVDALAGTLQTSCFEADLTVEHRWHAVGIRGGVGPEVGRRTAGMAALDGAPWDPYFGIGIQVATILYFVRDTP